MNVEFQKQAQSNSQQAWSLSVCKYKGRHLIKDEECRSLSSKGVKAQNPSGSKQQLTLQSVGQWLSMVQSKKELWGSKSFSLQEVWEHFCWQRLWKGSGGFRGVLPLHGCLDGKVVVIENNL